mgnify:CR=1 FL=1
MEKGFHNIEQFIAFITPGHTAFHERLSIGVYRRGRTREFSPHKEKPPPARAESIELLDGCFSLSQPSFVRCRSPPEAQEIHRNS